MISSNTRATRSRYSSPAQPQQNGSWTPSLEAPKSSADDSSRSFMQKWLEPSVQAKASFEEAGLMRYGVLENMAPLGARPKVKKATGDGTPLVRKIILRRSAVADDADDASAAREPQPRRLSPPALPEAPAAASAPPSAAPGRRKTTAVVKAVEDDEYDPAGGARRRKSGRVSLPKKARPSPGGQGSSASPAKPPEIRRISAPDPEVKEFTDKVVETAVDEALKRYRYPTAFALRTLYDEKSDDGEFVAMIEDVFNQTADAATMDEFSRLIEEKKHEGKRDNQGCYYFIPPATNSRFTPRKPKPAPYAHLIHSSQHQTPDAEADANSREPEVEAEADAQGDTRAAKKMKISHASNTPRKMSTKGTNASARTPGSRKRARRGSGSSDSSLSSAMSLPSPDGSLESASPSRHRGGRGGRGALGASTKANDAPKPRPITTRRKSLASKHQPAAASSNASDSRSPTTSTFHTSHTHHTHNTHNTHNSHRPHRHQPSSTAADASMPGRLSAAELFPNLPRKSSDSSKEGVEARMLDGDHDDDDAFWDRRRDAQRVTNGFTSLDSSVRGPDGERHATPSRSTRQTRRSLAPLASARATRSTSKRPSDDVDSTVSPVALSFHGDGSSSVGSRAATPMASPRPGKKQKTGLRIKSSPVKKKGGTAAGVPRSMGEAQFSATNGVPGAIRDPTADNDEHCSACGNAGDVVCCDGCPRSFHFECVDMVPTDGLPDEWYCNECLIKRYPSRVPVHKGAFAGALNNLEKSIPRAFSLPKKLQNRFEGVKAGADGDYEEVMSNKMAKKKTGYDEMPDFFRQREDGQAVLCHACQKPATEIKAIISCSACPLYWHLDCLEIPLAVPPVLKTWRCPAHVGDVLAEAPRLAPAHRFRKLKSNHPITPIFTRGTRNNGHIEVTWNDEPEEPRSGWPDPPSFGRTYTLPAQGVVLDFIEQLRHQGAGYGARQNESKVVPYQPGVSVIDAGPPLSGSALDRKVEEMQLSLNLISLKQKQSQGVDQLTSALLATADQNVLTLMAKANAENLEFGRLTADDRLGLRAMLAQMDAISSRVRDLLGENAQCAATSTLASPGATSVTEVSAVESPNHKMEPVAPVTEPTPPSTIDQAESTMDLD